jgi:hypothetical protein
MKKLFFLIAVLPFLGCLKDKKEEVIEDIVIKSVTDGQWKVTNAYVNDVSYNVSTWFAPYQFQFKTDKTVEAINTVGVENTGTWDASAEKKTITSNFTNTTSQGLLFLNGTWSITSSTWTTVDAKQITSAGDTKVIHMDKL